MKLAALVTTSTLALSLSMTACMADVKMGGQSSKSVATGSAGGANSQNVNSNLQQCAKPLGTIGVREDTNSGWYAQMNRNGVQSVNPILRLLAQQSNCFVVVERSSRGLQQMENERILRDSGELRSNSKMQKGQIAAADYNLTPTLIFNANDTGGIGGLLGRKGALLGAALKTKQAQSMLTLVDNRSGIQVAVAEGSAKAHNISGLLGAIGGSGAGALGAYTKTPTGKVVVGSLMDAFNNLVIAVKNYSPQQSSGPEGHGTGGALQTY